MEKKFSNVEEAQAAAKTGIFQFSNPSSAKARKLVDGFELHEKFSHFVSQTFKNPTTGEESTSMYLVTVGKAKMKVDETSFYGITEGCIIHFTKESDTIDGRKINYFQFSHYGASDVNSSASAAAAVQGVPQFTPEQIAAFKAAGVPGF